MSEKTELGGSGILLRLLMSALMFVFIAPWLAGVWGVGILVLGALGVSDHASAIWGMFALPVWLGLAWVIANYGHVA